MIMRCSLALMLGLMGAQTIAATPAGYLTRVGPAPLRFGQPSAPIASVVSATSTNATAPSAAPKTEPAVAGFRVSMPGLAPAPASVVAVSSGPSDSAPCLGTVGPATPEEAVVNPLLFLDFFKQGKAVTNDHETTVVVPINFVPPRRENVPSSTATYDSR